MAATPPPPPPPLHELLPASHFATLHASRLKPLFFLRSAILLFFLSYYRLHPSFFTDDRNSNSSSSSSSSSFSYPHLYAHHKPHLLLLCTALLCELWLSLQAHLSVFPRLRLLDRAVHPARLFLDLDLDLGLDRDRERDPGRQRQLEELPRVDVFVTTADPVKEPPIITLNTLLSALALDYSPARLACYVSDDAGSILNLWALKLAAAFSRDWLPFCRTFGSVVSPRAPGPYFAIAPPPHTHMPTSSSSYSSSSSSSSSSSDASTRFVAEWASMKAKYEELERRVSSMTKRYRDNGSRAEALEMMLAELMVEAGNSGCCRRDYMASVLSDSWAAVDYDSRNHQAYCEVLIENSEEEELPCLVYMSREKSLQCKHHYKAGNMNALIRVSGIFTNAPFILNLDCDTYVNDGTALLQAMCFFMDSAINPQLGFVQFPQIFEGKDADDSFAAALEVFMKGWDSGQGPPYIGTSCIHKREALYGKTPDGVCINSLESKKDLGSSAEFNNCAAWILTNKTDARKNPNALRGDPFIQEAIELISCRYEDGTNWGKEAGLIYGAVAEDVLTGLKVHGRGWKSVFCSPKNPAFLGGLPIGSEDLLRTRRRWSTGFLEIMVGTNSPFSFTSHPKLGMIQRLKYISLCNSIAVGIPLAIYALLPCASLMMGTPLFPKMGENPMWLLLGLSAFVSSYGCTCVESMMMGVNLQEWWDGDRMEVIAATSSNLFAACDVLKKLMGISDTRFEVTPKDRSVKTEEEKAAKSSDLSDGFMVNSKSSLFVPPTVIVMLNLVALSQFLLTSLTAMAATDRLLDPSPAPAPLPWLSSSLKALSCVEAWCCAWVLFVLQPFAKGLLLWCAGDRPSPLALHSSVVFLSSSCSFIVSCILILGFKP